MTKKNPIKSKKIVFVGLSGGVDSSVSAALLQQATPNNFEKLFGRPTPKGFRGYDVVGVFIRTWHPDFIECNEEEERKDAMRVAAHLDIPFLTFDLEEEYKKGVADYMISEYKKGRTPNPDVMCNKEVKFGAFLSKALSMGADFVATGHYAKVAFIQGYPASLRHPSQKQLLLREGSTFSRSDDATQDILEKKYHLVSSKDATKDQVYFLWTLNQERLSKILFPVGDLKKAQVRTLAKKFKLPVSEKKDSQGICFLGDIDLKDFLKHYIKEKKGKVLNIEGEEIGSHDGAVFHTLGERHGFTITKKSPNDGAYYVVAKDLEKNILVVSQDKNLVKKRSDLKENNFSISLDNVNWVNDIPQENKKYTAQIRYHGEFLPCTVTCKSKALAEVVFDNPVLVAPGQSVVLYDKDTVLGGGVVV